MKTFILDADHNITVYTSQQDAANAVPAGDAFTTAAGLRAALKNYSAATAVGIWNSLTGITPVRKFKDADTAAKRIFAEVQKLGGPDAAAIEAPVATRKTKAALRRPAGRRTPPGRPVSQRMPPQPKPPGTPAPSGSTVSLRRSG